MEEPKQTYDFYHQPDFYDNLLVKLEISHNAIMDISQNNPTQMIIGGDFNAGNINWDENVVELYSKK